VPAFRERCTPLPSPDDPAGRRRFGYDASWRQGPGVYGGLTAASLYRACADAAPAEVPDWRLRSMSLQYLAPVVPTFADADVTVVRRGASSTFLEARLVQDDRVAVHALATFGRDRSPDLDEARAPLSGVPAPDDLPALPYLEGVVPVFTQHVDFRIARGVPFSGGSSSEVGAWLRFRDPPPSLDVSDVLGLLDSPPPAFLARSVGVRPASTVSFQVHLLRPPPPDPTAFWYVDVRSTVTAAGWSDEELWLYAPDRLPVAVGRQLVALVR
jgi:hypothetical protein